MENSSPQPQIFVEKKKTSWFKSIIIAFIIVVLSIIVGLLGLFCCICLSFLHPSSVTESYKSEKPDLETVIVKEDGVYEGINQRIAMIKIDHVIGAKSETTDFTLRQIEKAANDPTVKSLLIFMDSPGGAVTDADLIYHELMTKVKGKKPIVVYMNNLAASGGYYISCAGDYLIANNNTLTGSIGVIMSGFNFQGVMDKLGVSSVVYKSGDFKDMMSPTRPATEAEQAYIQNLITETYNDFCQIVSQSRKISIETLKQNNAIDGRVISGKQALKIGLVDANGYLEDAFSEAKKLANIQGYCEVITYKKNEWADLLNIFTSMQESKMKVQLIESPFPSLRPGVMYMLPEMYACPTETK